MFNAILFDLDGTLIDSVPDVRGALNRLLAEERRRELTVEEVRGMVGEGARLTVERAFVLTGAPLRPAAIDEAVVRYQGHYLAHPADRTTVYAGVFDVLTRFSGEGIRLGICTNKPKATTAAVLDALGLARFFRAVACPEDVAGRKPDPRHVLGALAMMDSAAAGAILVGDSETDMAAAGNAGIPAVAVSYGYAQGGVSGLAAAARVDCFSELPATLTRLAAARK